MTQAHERTATLSELVADEIRVAMTRRRLSGRDLATRLRVSPSWISYRLSGKQPIDLNDLLRIANVLGVGVHDLLPSPEAAAQAVTVRDTVPYPSPALRLSKPQPVRAQRPLVRHDSTRPPTVRRTARIPRPAASS